METIPELLKLAAVGLISGLFSAFVANRTHRTKRWWELRVVAYQDLINALSGVVYYYDKKYSAAIKYREISEEYEAKLGKFWDESYHKIKKAADSGVFFFTADVNEALKKFAPLSHEYHLTYEEHLEAYLAVARNCLETTVASANRVLRVKDGGYNNHIKFAPFARRTFLTSCRLCER